MILYLKTKRQHEIANALWNAYTTDEMELVIKKYGVDAIAIRDYMIAEDIDSIEDIDMEECHEILFQIMYGY